MRLALIALLLVAGCGDDTTTTTTTMDLAVAQSGADLALLSRCGHYGDTGNSLGVGLFCTKDGDQCSSTSKAKTCSALLNGTTPSPTDSYFCSFVCAATDPAGTCGENAACLCNSSGCACIPARCITAGDGGM